MKRAHGTPSRWALAIAALALVLLWTGGAHDDAGHALRSGAGAAAGQFARDPSYPPAFPNDVPRQAAGERLLELCGHGPIPADHPPPMLEAEADAVLLRRIEALEHAGDDRSRGLGLAARAALMAGNVQLTAIRETARCDVACFNRATQLGVAAARPAVDALARLASSTRDPQVYASAMQACAGSDATECGRIDASRWAQIDADNGYAWLRVATKADRQGDPSGALGALERAARSATIDARFTLYPLLLQEADTPRDAVQALLVNKVLMLSARNFGIADYSIVLKYCEKSEVAGAERLRLCGDLARALVEKDTNLLGYTVGLGVGGRVGWPADRLARLREEHKALMESLGSGYVPANPYGCEGATQLLRHVRNVMLVGETTYGRQVLAARQPASAGDAPPK